MATDYESLVTDSGTGPVDTSTTSGPTDGMPNAAPTPEGEAPAPTPEEAAAAAAASAEPPKEEPPAPPAPKTSEFLALQQAQRKIHMQSKALKDQAAKIEAERAEIASGQKMIADFRALAAKAEDDPYALLDGLGLDRTAFFDALTRKALGEAPSADDRVNRLERELRAKETAAQAEAKARAEAEAKAAEEAKHAEEEAFIEANAHAVAAFLEHDPDAYPVLRTAAAETEGLMLREVVSFAQTWKDTHGEQLSMPKACEMLETRLLERSVQRLGKFLESPKMRARILETFKLQPIPPPAPAPAAPASAPGTPQTTTEPTNGRAAGVRPPTIVLSQRDREAQERQARYESLVKP